VKFDRDVREALIGKYATEKGGNAS
jgi:hypothetical protein